MIIAIGSNNPVKQAAARDVFLPLYADATFIGAEVPSGIPDQPWGDAQTRQGAINRARAAQAQFGADVAVGFEGGLIRTELGIMTCAWAAIYANDGTLGIGGGAHMMLPSGAAKLLEEGLELGAVMDKLTGQHNTKHASGAIGLMTDDLETRTSAYAHILRLALAPFRSPQFFEDFRP